MKFFTKSNLISIATLALVCIPSVAVSAASFKPSQTSEYSTLEMVNPEPAELANETSIARRLGSGHGGDMQNAFGNSDTTASIIVLLSGRSFTDRVVDFFDLGRW
ncbi:MAG: hypothetical protein ACK53E_10470 [Pseudanabaena sp.]